MQNIKITLLAFFLLFAGSPCMAEVIYFKDGGELSAKIKYRKNDTIWVESGTGAVGIEAYKISRIENTNGSISKFDFERLVGQVRDFISRKEYERAEGICGVILEASPGNEKARYLRALLNQRLGNADKATEDYDFLIKDNLASGGVFNNLGVIYARQKKYAAAAGMFSKAVILDAGRPELHNNLAETFMEQKDYGGAVEEYGRVVELEPGNAEALFNLGVAYKEIGDFGKAKAQWERLLRIDPEDADAKNALMYLKNKGY